MEAETTLVFPVHALSYRMLERKLDQDDLELPNLRRLVEEGTRGVSKSVFSTSSAVDYASMMTGCSPGTHGIEDFQTNILSNSVFSHDGGSRRTRFLGGEEIEDTRPYTYYDLDVPWLWHAMEDQRVAQFGLFTPATYPAPQLPNDGLWVSGYWSDPTSFLRDSVAACNDPEVRQELIEEFEDYFMTPLFAIPPLYPEGVDDELEYLEQCMETMRDLNERLHEARISVLEDRDFDIVLTEEVYYDNVQHLTWPHPEDSELYDPDVDPELAERRVLGRFLEHIDALLGRYMELYDDPNVIVFSCHGQEQATERHSMHEEFDRLYRYGVWDAPEGWEYSEERPAFGPDNRANHDYDGVYLVAGPDMAEEGEAAPISCMDFAPLLLTLYGHDVPAYMDGRVPEHLIED